MQTCVSLSENIKRVLNFGTYLKQWKIWEINVLDCVFSQKLWKNSNCQLFRYKYTPTPKSLRTRILDQLSVFRVDHKFVISFNIFFVV